jgi:uncharacterized membrane protein
MVEVHQTDMRLKRPGHGDLVWTDVNESHAGGGVVLRATDGGHSPVELVIESTPSRDTMSGAYYGLSARLILDGETFTGSALRGVGSD